MTILEEAPAEVSTDDDLVHVVCFCDLEYALCGELVTDDIITTTLPTTCVVCADLEPQPCQKCGAP